MNYLANLSKFYDYAEQSRSNIKAEDSLKNLEVLDILANKFVAKTTKVLLNGNYVSKSNISHLQDISNGEIYKNYGKYGHLTIDDKNIRISTCINLPFNCVQIPIKEERYWNKDTYIFFTNGDLFLMVNSQDFKNLEKIRTKYLNYQCSLNKLLDLDESIFGLLKDHQVSYCFKDKEKIIDLDSLKLSKSFYEYKFKGCMSSFEPKYLVLEKNDDIDFDVHGSTFKSLKAIEENYHFGLTRQYLGRIATKNAEILDYSSEHDFDLIFSKLKKISSKKQYYIIAVDEHMSSYLKLFKEFLSKKREEYNESLDRKCSVKRAIFFLKKIKSSEEYSYYKKQIIEQVGKDFTLRDCIFLREFNQIDDFKYSDSEDYHYYKRYRK